MSRFKSKAIDEKIANELISMNNPKKEKVALFWILKGSLILPEDQDKLDQAFNLIEKQHLDFQQFDGPMYVINREDKSTKRINAQSQIFNPDKEATFKDRKDLGDKVVIYTVDDTKEGQMAVRKAIDVNWDYDKNPWCLVARKNAFSQQEINELSEEQKEKLGLNSKDELAIAWNYWNVYNSYPKRIAFKNGKLLAFSAGNKSQLVEWWDRNDKSYENVKKIFGVEDDGKFLQRHGKANIIKYGSLKNNKLYKLANDENISIRQAVAGKINLSPVLIEKLANDEMAEVRGTIAARDDLFPILIEKLANDRHVYTRSIIADRKDISIELIEKLANDESSLIRSIIAAREDIPPELIEKFVNDKDWHVRIKIAYKHDLFPKLIEKLANDNNWIVRRIIASRDDLSPELVEKLANDDDERVRQAFRNLN